MSQSIELDWDVRDILNFFCFFVSSETSFFHSNKSLYEFQYIKSIKGQGATPLVTVAQLTSCPSGIVSSSVCPYTYLIVSAHSEVHSKNHQFHWWCGSSGDYSYDCLKSQNNRISSKIIAFSTYRHQSFSLKVLKGMPHIFLNTQNLDHTFMFQRNVSHLGLF